MSALFEGSSPLTRGAHRPVIGHAVAGGLIPAHAGSTQGPQGRGGAGWAHPRSRGEHRQRSKVFMSAPGSSPLTRGARDVLKAGVTAARLIPAHAGSTSSVRSISVSGSAHPRSRGEHGNVRKHIRVNIGSSPLTRGARRPGAGLIPRLGLIPAHAGSTYPHYPRQPPDEAHPRSRGEHTSTSP